MEKCDSKSVVFFSCGWWGDWQQPFAVADGKLVLGQNPASSAEVAKLVLAAF
jgi:putative intracellular protease/amidase